MGNAHTGPSADEVLDADPGRLKKLVGKWRRPMTLAAQAIPEARQLHDSRRAARLQKRTLVAAPTSRS